MSYSHCAGDCVVPYLQLGSAPAIMYAYQTAERKVRHQQQQQYVCIPTADTYISDRQTPYRRCVYICIVYYDILTLWQRLCSTILATLEGALKRPCTRINQRNAKYGRSTYAFQLLIRDTYISGRRTPKCDCVVPYLQL
jgi:hypothetical protein